MDTHFAVLPLDVIDAVATQLPDEIPRFLRLPHPRTGIGSLFLAHESTSNGVCKILEVQAVAPPNARSWFMGDEVISDGKLLVMTPVDPLFLLIPILGAIKQLDGGSGQFCPAEDMFEAAARAIAEGSAAQDSPSVGVDDVMAFAALECTQKAMGRLCDVKEITPDITVFRYSADKLLEELRKKVARLSTPRVMEMSKTLVRSLAKDGLMEDKHEALLELGRTKVACELLGQYLPGEMQARLLASYDLTRLDAHLKALRKETVVELAEKPKESKKRKLNTDGKGSLKKVNVKGMSKLSTYFKK